MYQFKPSDMLLGYNEFEELCGRVRKELDNDDECFLYAWEMQDLAMSPMPDDNRKILRLGYFYGYFDALKEK